MQSFHDKQFMLKPEILAKARDYYNDVVEIAKIKKNGTLFSYNGHRKSI